MSQEPAKPQPDDLAALLDAARALTPARVLAGRIGTSYRTETQLALREDHAEAVDAVHAEIDLSRELGPEFVARWDLVEVRTCAADKSQYLLRPDLGRRLDAGAVAISELTCAINR